MTTKHYLLTLLICCCYTITWGQIDPQPNDSLEEELEIRTVGPPSIPLACNITTFDFQEVTVGESVTRQYLIRNIGHGVLYIKDIEIIGSNDFSFSTSFNPAYGEMYLEPGQQASLFITFAPISAGEKNAEIIIRNSDADEGVCGFELEGDGYQESSGQLQVSTIFTSGHVHIFSCGLSTLGFPGLLPGETQSITHIITNIGTTPLFFNGIILEGSQDFSISYNFPFDGTPFEIASGENVTYDITYTPTSPGEQEANYYIYSSDEDQNSCYLQLRSPGYEDTPGELQVCTIDGQFPGAPLSCGETTIPFPDVAIGEQYTMSYSLKNIGTLPLFFNGIEIEGSQDFSVSYDFPFDGSPFEISGGESVTFNITFTPISAGEHQATYSIYTSDENQNPCAIQLVGEGFEHTPGQLQVRSANDGSPSIPITCGGVTTEFPDLPLGATHTRTYMMRNVGTLPLYFTGITLEGSQDFTISYNFPFNGLPVEIPGGESLTYDITFAPSSAGEKDAVYYIYTSDENQNPCVIELEGGGLVKKVPALAIFDHEGNSVRCGGTIHFDLSEISPGPTLFGFYFTFRNYGTANLSVGGTVSIQGVPGSSQPIDYFTVEPLEWIFLNTQVLLPGNQVTTLVYILNTNDPNQPFCTIYVEINQVPNPGPGPGPYPGPVDTKSKANIQSIAWDKGNTKNASSSNLATLSYQTIVPPQQQGLKLFPTVAHDVITLETSSPKRLNYKIIDLGGNTILSGQTNGDHQERIAIESLAAGMYLLQLEGFTQALRFVKTR